MVLATLDHIAQPISYHKEKEGAQGVTLAKAPPTLNLLAQHVVDHNIEFGRP